MVLTRERLNWAGTLAIVNAVLVLPMIAFNIWMNTVSGPVSAVLLFVRGCLLLPIAIFILLTLRRLLNERAGALAWAGRTDHAQHLAQPGELAADKRASFVQ